MLHSSIRRFGSGWYAVSVCVLTIVLMAGAVGGWTTPVAAQATPTAGGQFKILTGNIEVVWPAGWSVLGKRLDRITLNNPAGTMHLTVLGNASFGTWADGAATAVAKYARLQGPNATMTGPVVTDSGYMFVMDGQQGPIMTQGSASANPTVGIEVDADDIAPGSDLNALAAEAHGVTINGTPALQGIEQVIPSAASPVAAAGGHDTLLPGNIEVVWPVGWSVLRQDQSSLTLSDPWGTMLLTVVGYEAFATWAEDAASTVTLLSRDQGPNATISGPLVTDTGYMFVSDGLDGPRMVQGSSSSDDPTVSIGVLAARIAPGSDLNALAAEAHGVTINGTPALQGIEQVIPPSA